MVTHYDALEVSTKASPETIKAAYKSLIQRYHPDRNPGDRNAVTRTQRLNEAYRVPSNVRERSKYDAELAAADHLNRDRQEAARAAAEKCRCSARKGSIVTRRLSCEAAG